MTRTQSTTLSLIISSLDEGEELLETLRSVFAGSIVPAETIIVDDGGTDGSCDALENSIGSKILGYTASSAAALQRHAMLAPN